MDSFPKKPCIHCQGTNHFPYACFKNPKNQARAKKGIPSNKKHAQAWDQTRKTWMRKNPPPIEDTYWECYLRLSPNCRVLLTEKSLTLDHVVSKSRDPSKRHDLANLRPACWTCNTLKGSRDIQALENQYGRKFNIEN